MQRTARDLALCKRRAVHNEAQAVAAATAEANGKGKGRVRGRRQYIDMVGAG